MKTLSPEPRALFSFSECRDLEYLLTTHLSWRLLSTFYIIDINTWNNIKIHWMVSHFAKCSLDILIYALQTLLWICGTVKTSGIQKRTSKILILLLKVFEPYCSTQTWAHQSEIQMESVWHRVSYNLRWSYNTDSWLLHHHNF